MHHGRKCSRGCIKHEERPECMHCWAYHLFQTLHITLCPPPPRFCCSFLANRTCFKRGLHEFLLVLHLREILQEDKNAHTLCAWIYDENFFPNPCLKNGVSAYNCMWTSNILFRYFIETWILSGGIVIHTGLSYNLVYTVYRWLLYAMG